MGKIFKKYITVRGAIEKNDKPIEIQNNARKRKLTSNDEDSFT